MAWWQRSRIEAPTVRPAGPTDRPLLADLLLRALRHFGSQAVEDQMVFLNSGLSSLALMGSRAVGFLGLRPRTRTGNEHWADLALASLVGPGALNLAAGSWPADTAIQAMLTTSLPALQARGITGVVCLTGETWLYNALLEAGFRVTDRVITYMRNNRPIAVHHGAAAALRRAGPAEADAILDINAAAFAPVWRYDDATTLSWLLTAEHAILAESEGQPVGFALTSRASTDGYAQLIRLATHPAWQGQGIGRQLVVDAINYSHRIGALGVALNTQASNSASRHLYESLGFRTLGPALTVLVYQVQ